MTTPEVMSLGLRDTFVSPCSGMTLTVVGRSFGVVEVEDVLAGKAPAIEVRATGDGRGYMSAWHSQADGPETEGVWAERWSAQGCEFHGVVDSVSRKIVQAG